MTKPGSVGGAVLQAIRDIHAAGRHASREAISAATALKMSIVDDHVKSLRDDGLIRRAFNGVFEPILDYGESRAISKTMLANGMCKLEIGDQLLELTPSERRTLGRMMAGDAEELNTLTTERAAGEQSERHRAELRRLNAQVQRLTREVLRLSKQAQNGLFDSGLT